MPVAGGLHTEVESNLIFDFRVCAGPFLWTSIRICGGIIVTLYGTDKRVPRVIDARGRRLAPIPNVGFPAMQNHQNIDSL